MIILVVVTCWSYTASCIRAVSQGTADSDQTTDARRSRRLLAEQIIPVRCSSTSNRQHVYNID